MVNSIEEPLPGWIDNMNGPAALFLAGFIGMGQVFYVNPHAKLNMIPCDATVHGLIISAYALVTKPTFLNNSNDSVEVLNNCLSSENLMSQRNIITKCYEVAMENPSEKSIWVSGGTHTTCWIRFFLHVNFAYSFQTGKLKRLLIVFVFCFFFSSCLRNLH